VGHWRNGLCDCCILGLFHPLCWLTCCFPPVALGQVMTRMKLTPCGDPDVRGTTSSWGPFKVMLAIMIALFVASSYLTYLYFPLVVFLVIATTRTRAHVRRTYNIPETSCHGCEDCCCAYWCGCCTVAQMARHTADYGVHQASFCSETGLSDGAPPTIYPHVV
jgi:Cys-rich protein (TIGR01571 family)